MAHLRGRLSARTFVQEVPRHIYVLDDGLVELRPPRLFAVFALLRFIGRPLLVLFGGMALERKRRKIESLGRDLTSADLAASVRGALLLPTSEIATNWSSPTPFTCSDRHSSGVGSAKVA